MKTAESKLPSGFMGRIAFVDLGTRICKFESLDPDIAVRYFGGRGLGTALLYRHFASLSGKYKEPFREIESFSSDNPVIITTSPATGTKMPGSGRFHMNFKSPLTGGIGSSNSGGFWGVSMKKTGIDVLYITGKSETPVYLIVEKDKISFKDASAYEDATTDDSSDRIASELPKGGRVMSIGAAGKNLNRYAAVLNEKGRAFGRCGGGAVWGSKNLYAIAVVPDADTEIIVADPDMLSIKNSKSAAFKAKMMLDVGKLTRKEVDYGILSSLGSLGLMGMVHNHGQLPHNNMRDTSHDDRDIDRISGEALRYYDEVKKKGEFGIKAKKGTCFNCPVACKRHITIYDENGEEFDTGEGPEFESVTLLGANLSIYDLPLIARANNAANRLGMDTISLGGTISAFVDLYEICKAKDSLTELETQFMKDVQPFVEEVGEPVFGNKDILLPVIDLIAKRQGVGEYLAEGSYRFGERYGHTELSMTVKKQELPAYDPRTSFSQALSYEMSNRGGCHLEGGYMAAQAYAAGYGEWDGGRTEGTPLVLRNAAFRNTVFDTIGSCVYTSFSIPMDDYAKLLNAVTGMELNAGKLQRIGHRVYTLERLFNVMCGLTKADDWLPERFFTMPAKVDGRDALCDRKAFEHMHTEYYHAMGWNSEGVPDRITLDKLEIDGLVGVKTTEGAA